MWEVNNINQISTQHLNALRAKRCDRSRELARELDDILVEIQLIDRELNKRKDVELEVDND